MRGQARRTRRAELLDMAVRHVAAAHGWEHDYWHNRVGQTARMAFPGDGELEIEVQVMWDSVEGGAIRVVVSVLHTSVFDILVPTYGLLVTRQ